MAEWTYTPIPKTQGEERAARDRAARTVGLFVALVVLAVLLAAAIVLDRLGLGSVWAVLGPVLGSVAYKVVARWGGDWKWLTPFLPEALSAERKRRQAIEAVVDSLESAVSYYRLETWLEAAQGEVWSQETSRFREAFKSRLIDAVPFKARPEDWPKVLIDQLVQRVSTWEGTARGAALLLLVQERRGQVDAARWQEIRESDEDFLAQLADVLLHSERLPLQKEGQDWRWDAADLVALLKLLNRFSWDALHARIAELNDLAEIVFPYLTFLSKNGLDAVPPTLSRLAGLREQLASASSGRWKAPLEASLLTVEGEKAIGEALAERNRRQLPTAEDHRRGELLDDVTSPMLLRYARLSAVIFLARTVSDDPAEKHLCWELAQDGEAVRIAWAYLDLKKDLRIEKPVSFSYLIENWRAKLRKSRRRRSFQKEVEALQSALDHGEWVVRLQDLLERVQVVRLQKLVKTPVGPGAIPGAPAADWQTLAHRAVEQLGLGERPDLLAKALRKVDLETIGRNLETERFIPYLITFQTKLGPLSQLIDLLTAPKKLEAAGIEIRSVGERWKYNFGPYTDNARFGLVPEGMTFEELQRDFQEDLMRVLNARDRLLHPDGTKKVELQGIEVMLHRFSGIGRYHYPFESPFSSHLALSRLKDVLAENLSQEELLTLVQSGIEGDLKTHILGAAIPEIVGREGHLTPAVSHELAGQDSEIKRRLLEACHVDSIPEMGKRLAEKEIDHQKATETLTELIQLYVPQLDQRQSHDIADLYLQDLGVLAA